MLAPQHAQIAIATCRALLPRAPDQPLIDALADRGAKPTAVAWDDPAADWTSYAACIVRSTWDWHLRPDAFDAWITRAASCTRLFNDAHVMRWALDKRYLLELERAGVPVIPTVVLPHASQASITAEARARGWKRVVAKPPLGATAYRTRVIDAADDGRAPEDGEPGDEAQFEVLLQPFVPSIHHAGEVSVMVIDGHLTHAVRKRPAPGDYRVQAEFGGTAELTPADADELRITSACLDAAPGRTTYARIDLVRDEHDRPRVIECELVEPELFLHLHPPAAGLLADAVLAALR